MATDHPRESPPDPRSAKKPRVDLEDSSTRLLLANLDYSTTEDDIVDFFRNAGADIERVSLVKVSPDNRVNGNAYIYLPNERSVDIALERDGVEFRGRKLRVSNMPDDQRTACVRGMPLRSSIEDVKRLFRGCEILDARSRPVRGGPPDMKTWFVDFADEQSFRRALALDRTRDGLMICIATAQGPRTPRTPRDRPPFDSRDDRDRRDDHRELRDERPPRDDRMRDERIRDERLRDERPRDERLRDERPRDERPRDERPRDERPRDERPRDERPRDDRPREERPRDERPRDERPRDERPRDERPRDDRPREERPRDDRPRDDRPRDDRPRDDRPRDDERDADRRDDDRVNGDRPPARFRSRSPSRYRDRDHEREGDRDHDRSRDLRDRDYNDRDFRDRDYRDRDTDRYRERDYRRSPDRYRDHDRRRYERERYDRREYDRDRFDRREERFDRRDYPRRYEREYDRRERDASRHDAPLDTSVTTVLTNLPFCEDRERVIDNLHRTLEDHGIGKVREIIPVGRRCGACVVIYRDPDAYSRALDMQSLSINSRKVHILPLEVPSVARVQKLQPGFVVEDILEDMRRKYGVESLYVRMKQSDQILLRIEDSRFLVRLLDIDGRPLAHSRYATVSYIPSRSYSEGGRPRRSPDDLGDPNGRGGSARDREPRDGPDSPGDRRRGPPDGPDDRDERRDGGSGDASRHGERVRSYKDYKDSEWKVQMDSKSRIFVYDLVEGLDQQLGVRNVHIDTIGRDSVVVYGGSNGEKERDILLNCGRDNPQGPFDFSEISAKLISEVKKRSAPADDKDDITPKPSPAKKQRTDDGTLGKKTPIPLRSAIATGIHVSPMTPSPADYNSAKKGPIDPELPDIGVRVLELRSVITKPDDPNFNYDGLCANMKRYCQPQKLVHTMTDDDLDSQPRAWSGTVQKGPKAEADGYLVKRSSQTDEQVKLALDAIPENVEIEARARWRDQAFDHLLTPQSVVLVVKGRDEGSRDRSSSRDGYRHKSRALFNGILQSLRNKQSLGLGKFVFEGTKYISLCIPPNPYICKKLRLPWRFQDFAGPDSLLLVVGPKTPGSK